MKTYERAHLAFICIPLFFFLCHACWGLTGAAEIDPADGVYDYAEVLDEREAADLRTIIAGMRAKHDMSFSVLTADGNDGKGDMRFADDFFERSILVPGQPADGLLLFVNMGERGMWISTHGRAIRLFSDDTLDEMISGIAIPLGRGDFYNGFQIFLSEADDVVSGQFARQAWLSLAIGVAFGVVVTVALILNHRLSKGQPPAMSRYLTEGFKVVNLGSVFIRSFVTSTPRPKRSSGGGSSTHRSSGGGTFGGRGGRF